MSAEELLPVTFWAWTRVTAKDREAPLHLCHCRGLTTPAAPTRPVREGENSAPRCRSRRPGPGIALGSSALGFLPPWLEAHSQNPCLCP